MKLSKKALLLSESYTLEISAKAKEMLARGLDIVNFSGGEPDFNTPDHINKSAVDAIYSGFTKYTPPSGTIELREAIANKLKQDNSLEYAPTQIIVSNGAKHSLSNSFFAILNEGDEVIIPAPYWLSYPQMITIAGGKPVIAYTKEDNNFKITKKELESVATSKTKALILNSPSNPTGVVYTPAELKEIADFAIEHDLFVISDEIYEKLIYDEECKHTSIASLNPEIFKRTIVINGLSKSHSMPGWRIGYAASNPEVAQVMSNIQSHCASNPNSIAQKAAFTAFTAPQDCIDQMREEFKKRRDYLYDCIAGIEEISCVKPSGAFYLFINISNLFDDAYECADILLNEFHIAAIPCNDFGYDKYIRLSYTADMNSIKKGAHRFEAFAKKYK